MSQLNNQFRPENHKQLLEKFRPVKEKFNYNVSLQVSPKSRSEVASGIEPYSGEWRNRNKMHLLKRTIFGPQKKDLSDLNNLTFNQSVDTLLTEVSLLPPPVNNYNVPSENILDPDTAFGESWVEAPYNNDYEGYKILSLKGWILKNIHQSPLSIHYKLTFFWHNLLVTQFWDIFQAKASYQYYKLLHDNAFGNFRTLIKEITINPAMLIYLNGTKNNKEAPDENYARELQELFCIGKGPDSKYTESDVQAAARVLTGWVVDYNSVAKKGVPKSFFFPPFHETGNKSFSSFYNDTVIEGKTNEAGEEELDDLLDMIFSNPETALFICRRLYNFFVYSEIDETTETNVIKPLANIFRENDYEIKPVLEALFKSAHFNDSANHGVVIKNPLDILFSSVKTLEIPLLKDEETLSNEFATLNSFVYWGSLLGLEIGDAPSVAGWPAYYQSPQFDKSWITTDSIAKRAQLTDMVCYAFYANGELFYRTDLIEFVKGFDTPEYPDQLIEEAELLFLGIPLSEKSKGILKSILLAGQQEDYHWSLAWNDHLNNPEDQEFKNVVENRLRSTFINLMQQGEYHLI